MILSKIVFVIVMIAVLLLSFKFLSSSFKVLETPNYQLKEKLQALEIRTYPKMVVASSVQNMERKPALRKGFRALFAYITGHNEKEQVIAMTIPVLQQGQGKNWQTSFIMPAKYEWNDLPQAKDKSVHLATIPAGDYLVLRFSGRLKPSNFAQKLKEIKQKAKQSHCVVEEPAIFAIYNRPGTVSFLRRNEVWLRLQEHCHLSSA